MYLEADPIIKCGWGGGGLKEYLEDQSLNKIRLCKKNLFCYPPPPPLIM